MPKSVIKSYFKIVTKFIQLSVAKRFIELVPGRRLFPSFVFRISSSDDEVIDGVVAVEAGGLRIRRMFEPLVEAGAEEVVAAVVVLNKLSLLAILSGCFRSFFVFSFIPNSAS